MGKFYSLLEDYTFRAPIELTMRKGSEENVRERYGYSTIWSFIGFIAISVVCLYYITIRGEEMKRGEHDSYTTQTLPNNWDGTWENPLEVDLDNKLLPSIDLRSMGTKADIMGFDIFTQDGYQQETFRQELHDLDMSKLSNYIEVNMAIGIKHNSQISYQIVPFRLCKLSDFETILG